jgi:hemolysin-activating ACP:hemolysin acyltransferase
MGLVDVVLGVWIQALHLFLALRVGDRFQLLRAAGIEALHAAARGGPEGRREQAFGALAEGLVAGTDDEDSRAFFEGTAAIRLFLHGRWKEVAERAERLESMFTTSPAGWHSNAQLFYVYALANLGRLRELRAYHSIRLAEAEERGELYTTVNLRIGHTVRVWLLDDDVDAARRQERPCDEDVFILRAAPERDDRVVLDHKPGVGFAPFGHGRMQRTLQRPYFAVRAPTEIKKPGTGHVAQVQRPALPGGRTVHPSDRSGGSFGLASDRNVGRPSRNADRPSRNADRPHRNADRPTSRSLPSRP